MFLKTVQQGGGSEETGGITYENWVTSAYRTISAGGTTTVTFPSTTPKYLLVTYTDMAGRNTMNLIADLVNHTVVYQSQTETAPVWNSGTYSNYITNLTSTSVTFKNNWSNSRLFNIAIHD